MKNKGFNWSSAQWKDLECLGEILSSGFEQALADGGQRVLSHLIHAFNLLQVY